VALFPQLIAGPIIRYFDVAKQLKQRTYTSEKILYGIMRFVEGLAKKVLLADVLGVIADKIFSLPVSELTMSYAWLGIISYTMQIYFDFSGYSDMAIGLGSIMGFSFLENFNRPYISQSFTEFWKRWHISLSNWMKEYLYIPLGGNRKSKTITFVNLWIVFLVSGLWHGANWTFIIWGAYHGLFLIFDKLFWNKLVNKIPKIFAMFSTFFFIMIGWIFFRSETLTQAVYFLKSMFIPVIKYPNILFAEIVSNRGIFSLVIAFFISFLPIWLWFDKKIIRIQRNKKIFYGIFPVLILILFFISVIRLASTGFNPFIYFKF
jgi:alginate O-acetyltransferase complex protein AlgI